MPRPKPITRDRRTEDCPDWLVHYFNTSERPEDSTEEHLLQVMTWEEQARCGSPALKEVWDAHKDELVAEFAEEFPGRRPAAWWGWEGHKRQQLSGGGRFAWLHYPAPMTWVCVHDANLDRWTDGEGKRHLLPRFHRPIMEPVYDCGVPYMWVDPDEADPVFESQATFLQRHGLLFEGEFARLTAEDFTNEILDESCEMQLTD